MLLTELAVLTPVLARPHRVRPYLESLSSTVPEGTLVVFVCDKNDYPEQRSIAASLHDNEYGPLKVRTLKHDAGYAGKINAASAVTDSELVLLAADDLKPEDGWLEAAKACMRDDRIHVVGVNDLIDRPHRPQHATHFLLTREYAERPTIDGREGPMFDGYQSWYADDELIETAKHRGVYTYCPEAHVEHLHPMVSKSLDDDTYRKGRMNARRDKRTYQSREHLWT